MEGELSSLIDPSIIAKHNLAIKTTPISHPTRRACGTSKGRQLDKLVRPVVAADWRSEPRQETYIGICRV